MENENLERDLNAIEKEKAAYLEGQDVDEDSDEVDVEETEFSLTEDEIDEWLEKLINLKENKGSIELEVDDETSLKINYEESGDSDESDELKSDEVVND